MVDYYPIILIKIKMFQIYFTTFLSKLVSPEWRKGYAMRFVLASNWSTLRGYCMPQLPSQIICYLTLFSESIGNIVIYRKH